MKKAGISKLLILIIIIIGLVSGFTLVKHTQDVRNQAKVPDNIGQVHVKITKEYPESTVNKVEITFKAVTANNEAEAISTLGFRLNLPGKMKIVNENREVVKEILPNGDLDGSWEFPVNSVNNNDDSTTIDFSAVNTTKEGYASLNDTHIATFYMDTGSPKNEVSLIFDPQLSFMYSKRRPVTDIWSSLMPTSYQVLLQ